MDTHFKEIKYIFVTWNDSVNEDSFRDSTGRKRNICYTLLTINRSKKN
jgi:hypothetical protein